MPDQDRRTECANCGSVSRESEIVELADCEGLLQRLDPGSEVPAGECPDCGAFCYLVPEEEGRVYVDARAEVSQDDYTRLLDLAERCGQTLQDCLAHALEECIQFHLTYG